MMRSIENKIQSPLIALVVDHSLSIRSHTDPSKTILPALKTVSKALEQQGLEVEWHTLTSKVNEPDSIRFNFTPTNISQALRNVQEQQRRPLSGIVLLSDGIYNAGIHPTYPSYVYPIFTIGIGDTTPRKDVKIKSVLYNKISYKGNQTPIQVTVEQKGFNNRLIDVEIREKSTLIAKQSIPLSGSTATVNFSIEPASVGLHVYTIRCTTFSEENNTINNSQKAVIEVVDNQQKILVVAPGPHPDIKAIQSALVEKANIRFDWYIPGIQAFPKEKYDVYLIHQYPITPLNQLPSEVLECIKNTSPKWFIVTNNTHIPTFNSINGFLQIQQRSAQPDQVFPEVNVEFSRFSLPSGLQTLFSKVPPVSSPYGEFTFKKEHISILYQRVGKTETKKPLLTVSADRSTMVFLGDGFWQWRLQEQALQQNTDNIDAFIEKIIQYLALPGDDRKFRVHPERPVFYEQETPNFEIEGYNELFERISISDIDMTVSNGIKKYTYRLQAGIHQPLASIPALPEGNYTFVAQVQLNGKKESARGSFIVEKNQLELFQTQADFGLLRQLSQQTNGVFLPLAQLQQLPDTIKKYNFKSSIESKERITEIIQLPWIFFLIVTLAGLEWWIRKKSGGY
ncbi:MAG: hypothetical protein MUE33_11435 [Cytophagaceae bacterium]|nr:hypothetical protein [Cytophagaceae bacterium]